ncbi:MAG: hypothetical protein MHM6MM_001026 [Cercozoa sp. M6MM]
MPANCFGQYVGKDPVEGHEALFDGTVRETRDGAEYDGLSVPAGLTPSQVLASRERHGRNETEKPPLRSFLALCWEQLDDKILQLLCVCAVVQIVLGVTLAEDEEKSTGWVDGFVIVIAVSVVVLTGAVTNYSKQRKFAELSVCVADTVVAVRRRVSDTSDEEHVQEVRVADVVVGDIVALAGGDAVPADGLVVTSDDLHVDESTLTGESKPVRKYGVVTQRQDSEFIEGERVILVGTTLCSRGGALCLVTAVGPNTYAASLTRTLQSETESDFSTPLQRRLEHLAFTISYAGLIAAVLTMTVLYVRFFATLEVFDTTEDPVRLLRYFTVGITILVVAVPEGLPLAVVLSLAFSVKRMMKDNNLVRNLHKCETMGGATTICSDKTGTMTENRMTVRAIFTCAEANGYSDHLDGVFQGAHREVLLQSVTLNIGEKTVVTREERSVDVETDTDSEETQEFSRTGNASEAALLISVFKHAKMDANALRQQGQVMKVFPFDSALKRMTTIVRTGENTARMLTKGAPEVVYKRCSHALVDGQVLPFDEVAQFVRDKQDEYAENAWRVLALAYKDLDAAEVSHQMEESQVVDDLVFVALVGVADPLRSAVPNAISTCHRAGITVRMVTGDAVSTAIAISKEAGILPRRFDYNNYVVMTGSDFRRRVQWHENEQGEQFFDQQRFQEFGASLRVLARASPNDKYILVRGLKAMNEVVAVTGDGTNDALALKTADVGFSMGIVGTDVAKQASDIVLLDDNFTSLVKAVKWGRNVSDSIKKFLQFQLTVSVSIIVVSSLGAIVDGFTPMTPVQLLWVNLVMDAFASLALATEPPSDDLLKRQPQRKPSLVSRTMVRNICGHSAYQSLVTIVLLFAGSSIFSIPNGREVADSDDSAEARSVHFTMIFNIFVLMQLFNLFNARILNAAATHANPLRGSSSNPLFMLILGVVFVGQAMMVELGGSPLKVRSLIYDDDAEWWMWPVCILFGASELVVGALLRAWVVEEEDHPEPTPLEIPELTERQSQSSLFHLLRRPPGVTNVPLSLRGGVLAVMAANRLRRNAQNSRTRVAVSPAAECELT